MNTPIKLAVKIFFTLILVLGCVKIEEKEVKYPNGQLKEKYTYYLDEMDQEIFDGEYKSWFESGSQKEQSFWDEGNLNGVQTLWYENGTKESVGTWMGAQKNGLFQTWHVNGNLKSEINFAMDVPIGLEKHWHQSGKLRSEINYVEGKKNGTEKILDNEGAIYATRYWSNGSLDSVKTVIPKDQIKVMKVEYSPGKPAEEFSYFLDPDGKQIKHGLYKEWYKTGTLERQVYYDVGIKSGLETWYYANGKHKMLTHWKMGKKEGAEKAWWANSEILKSSESYADGILHGPANHWYKNGEKQSEVTYIKGRLEGKAMYWYENGKLKSDYHYVSDTLDGLIVRGYKNGTKKSECYFKKGVKDGECKEYFENGTLMNSAQFKGGMKDLKTVKQFDSTGRAMVAGNSNSLSSEKRKLQETVIASARSCLELGSRVAKIKEEINSNTLYKDLQKKEIKLSRAVDKKKSACASYQKISEEFIKLNSHADLQKIAEENQFASLLLR